MAEVRTEFTREPRVYKEQWKRRLYKKNEIKHERTTRGIKNCRFSS